jgi:predicted small secreted protein
MRKTVLLISTIILGSLSFQACETLKGTGKDVTNTGDNISQGVNAVLGADRKFAEKYW